MKSIKVIPGTKVYEHLLVISPHEELWARIMAIKEEFAHKFHSDFAKLGKPHLTVANFIQTEMSAERIDKALTNFALHTAPFIMHLDGFCGIPSHNIHIVNKTKEPLRQMVQLLKKNLLCVTAYNEANKSFFIEDPHINIARKLSFDQYEQAWLEFKDRDFKASIIADSLIWLKRPVDTKKYQLVKRFDFQNIVQLK